MRTLLFIVSLFPLMAFAQDASAPMLVVDETKPPTSLAVQKDLMDQFPEWAVTNLAKNTTGQTEAVPASPPAPSAPAATPPTNPKAPSAPAAPESPVSKLWPVDTVPIFMPPCVGLHPELIAPCKCTITELMLQMPHDEFLRLSLDGSIEQDARLSAIRYRCVGTPRKKS